MSAAACFLQDRLLGRRALLAGVGAGLLAAALDARAMGRVPIGGELSLRVPWSTARLDPHDLFDPLHELSDDLVREVGE